MSLIEKLNKIPPESIQWGNFITPEDDATILNISFLSNIPEKHAIMVGLLVGLSGEKWMAMALIAYVTGGESKTIRKLRKHLPDTLHMRDSVKEIAYTGFSFLIGLGIRVLLWGLPIWVKSVV